MKNLAVKEYIRSPLYKIILITYAAFGIAVSITGAGNTQSPVWFNIPAFGEVKLIITWLNIAASLILLQAVIFFSKVFSDMYNKNRIVLFISANISVYDVTARYIITGIIANTAAYIISFLVVQAGHYIAYQSMNGSFVTFFIVHYVQINAILVLSIFFTVIIKAPNYINISLFIYMYISSVLWSFSKDLSFLPDNAFTNTVISVLHKILPRISEFGSVFNNSPDFTTKILSLAEIAASFLPITCYVYYRLNREEY